IRGLRLNRLTHFFQVLDTLDPQPRDKILDWAYSFIIQPRFRPPVTGRETMKERMIDELSYENFKAKCSDLTALLPDFVVVAIVVNITLQASLGIGDTTLIQENLDKFHSQLQWSQDLRRTFRGESEEYRESLNFVVESMKASEPDFKEEKVESFLDQMDRLLKKNVIEGYPERIRENYQQYVYF